MEYNNNNDIYFERKLDPVPIQTLFKITGEVDGIRVQNDNVNCYFKGINEQELEEAYNKYLSALNLNFNPLSFNNTDYELADKEQQELTQKIITSHIYFYTVNDLPITVKRSDFIDSFTIDQVVWLLDKKLQLKNKDTNLSLAFGAHLLRQDLTIYGDMIKGRRRYYDR
ncbi:hypothetical protein [Pedobacter xixiisoli]|uniref:Uncharacterized protein n=1 Tax=Pedobacter xixiisoli TaxID=1476464 RepID=A0A285ZP44_9SPHI|nr:hypothetical protein [Pedobacter xixiisoli]SOD11451.1 hypothetical protein SAMN06297358_0157 [Pedobacter xixiisoli]